MFGSEFAEDMKISSACNHRFLPSINPKQYRAVSGREITVLMMQIFWYFSSPLSTQYEL